jgi:hypothetical protein
MTRMLTVTLLAALSWTAGAWHADTSPQVPFTSHPTRIAPDTSEVSEQTAPPLFDPPSMEYKVDLYGNDVSDAVATYSEDDGGVYEEHSPQTEVAPLEPPTA